MSAMILLGPAQVRLGVQVIYAAGDLVPPVDQAAVGAAGGIMWPSSDPVVAQIAATQSQRLRGSERENLAMAVLSAAFFSLSGGNGGAVLGPSVAGGTVGSFIQKRSLALGFAAFAAATVNTFNVGAVLPPNVRIIARELRIAAPFTGGGLTSMTLSLGIAGRTTDVIAAQDVHATSGNIPGATGVDAGALYSAASQLIATLAGSAAAAPTAGSLVLDTLFAVVP